MMEMLEQICGMETGDKDKIYTDLIESFQKGNIVLYGAGGIGYVTSCILKEKACNIHCFVDDNKTKQGTYVNGIKVISLEELGRDAGYGYIVLICLPNPMDVYHRLISLGYKKVQYFPVMMWEKNFYNISLLKENRDKIDAVYEFLADSLSKSVFMNILKHRITMDFSIFDNIISQKQYFPSDIFDLNDRECFVDGGVYNGETIADFVNSVDNKFDYIYGFEPDKQNFSNLTKSVAHMYCNRLKLFNAGLYSKAGEISFDSHGNSASAISDTGGDNISLVRLDDVVGEHKPTYIKLDIEGAEKEALYGMKSTIAENHPKLAISIYHKAADIWELPLLIRTLPASYNIYIRHYTNGLHETVCYAI